MKKTFIALLLTLFCLLTLSLPVLADEQEPVLILHQPQNSVFPENSHAWWTLEAEGDDLVYEWFIVYRGMTYDTSKAYEENQPWLEGVSGAGFGQINAGNDFYIDGIGKELDGAEIFCRISRKGGKAVYSAKSIISVGARFSPPMLSVPAAVLIEQGEVLKLACDATPAPGDTIESYLWYETKTGNLQDIIAVGAFEDYEENGPVMVCDTSVIGTRYYVCGVWTDEGGLAYSGVIPVTVCAKGTIPTDPTTDPTTSDTTTDPATGDVTTDPTTSDATTDPATGGVTTDPATGDATTDTTDGTATSPPRSSDPSNPSQHEKPNEHAGGISTTAAILIALGGLFVGGGMVAAALIISKRRK